MCERNRQAIGELLKQSGAGLIGEQQRKLGAGIFTADEQNCTHPDIMQHHNDTNNALPIWMLPQLLPFAKCAAAEEKLCTPPVLSSLRMVRGHF